MNDKDKAAFEAWLCREIPAGTVISDPLWWSPKILKAALAHRDAQVAGLAEALRELTEAICKGRYEDPAHDRIYQAIIDAKQAIATWESSK